MTKISMAAAAKEFAVSRPTLLKHLQQGKITGEKVVKDKNEFWQIDTAELARVYPRRAGVSAELPANITNPDTPPAPDLSAEIRVLQAKLEAAEKVAEERARHIEDLRRLLDRPQQPTEQRVQWRWPWKK